MIKRLVSVVLCLLWAISATAFAAQDLVELKEGSYLVAVDPAAAALPPPDSSEWRTLRLPQKVTNPADGLVRAWFRIPFKLERASNEPLALMLPRLYSGGDVFLNGELIGRITGSSETVQAHWLRPHYFLLPAKLLHAGENILAIGVTSRYTGTRLGIGPPVVGSPEAVKPLYDRRMFIEYSMALVAVWLMLLGGPFLLIVWLVHRKESMFAVFGLVLIGWGIRTINHVVPYTPWDLWIPWRMLFYAGTAFGDMLLCIFLLRISGAHYRRTERFMLAYASVGSLAVLVVGQDFIPYDGFWYLGLVPFNLLACFSISRAAWRLRTWDLITLASTLGITILLILRDIALQMGMLPFGSVYLTHIGASFGVLAMSSILLVRFVEVMKRVEGMNVELEQRVRQREAEIIASHEALRALEIAQASASERQRIMQDMHDGLGSQLLSSLAMVERGAASQAHVAEVLRECIDDMRLVIDALTPGENDLLAALGTLRFRMTPRLAAAGIRLQWQIECDTDELEVDPRQGLAFLRIVQEAIANALKHAQASCLEVRISCRGGDLEIVIADNGIGFSPEARGSGRGLASMRQRASAAGAQLDITTSSAGTRLHLKKNLSPIHTVPA